MREPTNMVLKLSSLSLYEAVHKAIPLFSPMPFLIYTAKLLWSKKSQGSRQDSSPAFRLINNPRP